MLTSSGLPEKLWAEACNTATYLRNRVNYTRSGNKTPYEMWFGRRSYLANVHEFGREVHILDKLRTGSKWSPKTKLGHLVGYTHRRNTYRVYVPSEETVSITSDVIFRSHPTQTSPITVQEVIDVPTFTYLSNSGDTTSKPHEPPYFDRADACSNISATTC